MRSENAANEIVQGMGKDVPKSQLARKGFATPCTDFVFNVHNYLSAFVHLCICAFVHLCICAFVHSCIRAFVHSCIRAFVHSCIRRLSSCGRGRGWDVRELHAKPE